MKILKGTLMKMLENGRSMLEMLGVLAIIGVLSMAGIYGYTVAMRKYKANEILHVASMLYTLAQSANAGEGDCIKLSNTSLPKNPGGVSVDMVVDPSVIDSDPIIYIQINDTDAEAIQHFIENTKPEEGYSIDFNMDDSTTCASETN